MPDSRKPYSKPVLKRLERTPETEHIFKQLEKDYPVLRRQKEDPPPTRDEPEGGSESE